DAGIPRPGGRTCGSDMAVSSLRRLRRPPAGSVSSYTNDSPADRHVAQTTARTTRTPLSPNLPKNRKPAEVARHHERRATSAGSVLASAGPVQPPPSLGGRPLVQPTRRLPVVDLLDRPLWTTTCDVHNL